MIYFFDLDASGAAQHVVEADMDADMEGVL